MQTMHPSHCLPPTMCQIQVLDGEHQEDSIALSNPAPDFQMTESIKILTQDRRRQT